MPLFLHDLRFMNRGRGPKLCSLVICTHAHTHTLHFIAGSSQLLMSIRCTVKGARPLKFQPVARHTVTRDAAIFVNFIYIYIYICVCVFYVNYKILLGDLMSTGTCIVIYLYSNTN